MAPTDYEGKAEKIYRFIERSRDYLRAFDEGDKGAAAVAVKNLKAMSDASLAIIEEISPKPKEVKKPVEVKKPIKRAAKTPTRRLKK